MKAGKLLATHCLVVALCLCSGCFASAARLLTATVELDGKTVLQSLYPSDDYADGPTVWRYLAREPMSVETSLQVPVEPKDSLEMKLQGALVIHIRHVDRRLVAAQASELTLIRQTPTSDKWYLPADEVERLAQTNGIPALPARGLTQGASVWPWVIGLVALVVVLSIIVWIWFLARDQRVDEQPE